MKILDMLLSTGVGVRLVSEAQELVGNTVLDCWRKGNEQEPL